MDRFEQYCFICKKMCPNLIPLVVLTVCLVFIGKEKATPPSHKIDKAGIHS
jgi:hypothetical protein